MGKHRKDKGRFGRVLHVLFVVMKSAAIAGTALALAGVAFFVSYLMGLEEWREFEPEKIGDMQLTLLLYDKNGMETTALYNQQNRVYIPIDKIPEHVKNAFIAIEDARFYEHNGVDIIRIVGSLVEDLRRGDWSQGASTISQQLVKNTSLTGVKTISRKLQEAVMAYKLEQVYSKDQILEMYLNNIYFGNGAYGIEAAAKVYFGTTAESLSIAQGAMLAGTIKAPTHYAPHLNLQKSIERRNLVLSVMEKQGKVTSKQAKTAQIEPVVLSEKPEVSYGYYTDMVLREAEKLLNMDSEELLSSGCRIYTTLDQSLQATAEALFENPANFPPNAEDGELCQAALCVIDSKTNEIRAIVGGRSYETRRGINRATDIKRQPGSAIKPIIVYAPALEKLGYTPTTLVLDEKEDFNGYVPKNFDDKYAGWVTLRRAVEKSLNLPAVRVFSQLGVASGKLYASAVGIPFGKEDVGLTLALGGFTTGVSPLSMAAAFSPFANGGYYALPSCISKIEDGKGDVIYERPDTKVSVISSETAFFMTTMLESAATTGTARNVQVSGVEIAAKTGTSGADTLTGGNRDAWTVAYNPQYSISCWMGFDTTDDKHYLPSDVTGGTYPAKLISKVFKELYKSNPAPSFAQPDNIITARIDIHSLENGKEPMLASAFTPDNQTTLEYFNKKNAPTEFTTYWTVPSPPDNLAASHGDGGYPCLDFTPVDPYTIYRLMRRDVKEGISVMIGEYSGASSVLTINDNTAEYGHTYDYYVLPVHPEIKIKGERLCGPPSQTVRITVLAEDSYMP